MPVTDPWFEAGLRGPLSPAVCAPGRGRGATLPGFAAAAGPAGGRDRRGRFWIWAVATAGTWSCCWPSGSLRGRSGSVGRTAGGGAAPTEPAAAICRLVRGDMRRLPLADGSLRTVLSLFTAFGYFGSLSRPTGARGRGARVLARAGTGSWTISTATGCGDELARAGPGRGNGSRARWWSREARRLPTSRIPGGQGGCACSRGPGIRTRRRHWASRPTGCATPEEVALFTPGGTGHLAAAAGLRAGARRRRI